METKIYRRMLTEPRKRTSIVFAIFFCIIILPILTYAGVPNVSFVMVTDVTPRSFSVIWASSEASYPDLYVYDDAAGSIPTADAVITLQPVKCGNSTLGVISENNGVLKVKVTSLVPNTTYYIQTVTTSKSTMDVSYYPASTPLRSATTESLVVRTKMCGDAKIPFVNDLITVDCYLPNGFTPAEGTLLLAEVEGCEYPVSCFVGDCMPLPKAYIDLNNLFSYQWYETEPLFGGETLVLTQFMGIHGFETLEYFIPKNGQLSEIKFPLDTPPCKGDFDGDGDVDGSDLALFASDFGRSDCRNEPPCEGDFDMDCNVDRTDLAVFAADLGRTDFLE